MTLPPATLPPGQPDPVWLRRFLLGQRVFLAFVFIASSYTVTVWLAPSLPNQLPFALPTLSLPIAISALFCTFSLILSEARNPRFVVKAGRYVALIPALLTAAILLANINHLPAVPVTYPSESQAVLVAGSGALQAVVAFFALSIVLFLLQFEGVWIKVSADAIVTGLCLLALILISQSLFGTLSVSDVPDDPQYKRLAIQLQHAD